MQRARDVHSYQAAKELFSKKRFAEALVIYERLAQDGDPQCQVHIGWMYHEGVGVAPDREKARSWFQRAASLGSKEGAFYYARALGSIGRHEDAASWFQKAARQNYSPALLWLGLSYVRGLGMPTDFLKGVDYLQRAADAGNIFAKRELGLLMTRGRFGLLKVPLGYLYLLYSAISGVVVAIYDPYSDRVKG